MPKQGSMNAPEPPDDAPSPATVEEAFHVYGVQTDDERVLYFGEPLVGREELVQAVWPTFREAGYEVRLAKRPGEYVLVAEPRDAGISGIPWTNVLLAVATIFSTLWAGSMWYYVENPLSAEVLRAVPFTIAIMTVLGVHEMGHYLVSRYHDVDASLPYFLPVPTFIGTMGAVIRMKGQMPDRKALFDIGVAGPLAGLVATVVVTVVGLHLDPVTVPQQLLNNPDADQIRLGHPPLLEFLAWAFGQPLSYGPGKAVNPVVIGGWVGMFVTFLNLLPVGQLDGGHIVRALVGKRQETVAAVVPVVLFTLAGYLFYVQNVRANAVGLWVVWGVLAMIVAAVGPATPVSEESLDRKRVAVGLLTFALGVLCFTPTPIVLITG